MISQAEKIRQYFRDHPEATQKEASEKLRIDYGVIRSSVGKDVKANRCIRLEDGKLDYSPYFDDIEERIELTNWKNSLYNRMIERLMDRAEVETNSNEIRLIYKEVHKYLKEVTVNG